MNSAARIAIKGGRVIDPANKIDQLTDLYVADGRIVGLGESGNSFVADMEVDAQDQIVCSGFIDLCARPREPGQEYKATIASETATAARAGITTLCCPPDCRPVADTPAVVELLRERAEQSGKACILPIGALTQGLDGKLLSEMSALKDAGCVAVSNALAPVANSQVLRNAIEYAATYDLLIVIRPEDVWLRNEGCVHESPIGNRLGLPGIPVTAESVAVAQALALVEDAGARAHFGQLSCAQSVVMISRAQFDGVQISADVSAHQLHLTEQEIEGFNAGCHVIPPLRTAEDRDGLRSGLARNVISAICSDHQPHEEGAKLDAFSVTEPGISALESLLPLTLKLVDEDVLSLNQAVARLTSGPAGLLRLDAGHLQTGGRADICIFDSNARWTINTETWCSRGLNTPFWGQEMKGRVTHTIFGGDLVYQLEVKT